MHDHEWELRGALLCIGLLAILYLWIWLHG
jgi:hypothetical protein